MNNVYTQIGKYEVHKGFIDLYIRHFAQDKSDIQLWDTQRKVLHDAIFESVELDRFSEEGQEFNELLEKYIEPKILKFDSFMVAVKRLSNAKTDEEIKMAQTRLQIEIAKTNARELAGFRNKPPSQGHNRCRVCDKDLEVDGEPRYNDHLACVRGYDEIEMPSMFKTT